MDFKDIERLHSQGSLRDIDFYLAEMLSRRYPGSPPAVLLAAALASRNLIDNHICLELDSVSGTKWPQQPGEEQSLHQVTMPHREQWCRQLLESEVCSADAAAAKTPLVLFGTRLYLRRYAEYEKTVAEKLLAFSSSAQNDKAQFAFADDEYAELLRILFPGSAEFSNAKQLQAAEVILKNRLLILSGGPGSGKTYTLARLTALLVAACRKSLGRSPVIKMAAPTGKAAMRMCESVRAAKKSIAAAIANGASEAAAMLRDGLPDITEDASTLHRLLGTIMHSSGFRHNADNPLDADIVVVDEASMIDLALMAKLLGSLRNDTKLILLGDMHQLASVNPGYVLGDICRAAQAQPESGLGQALVTLDYSHRFKPGSPVDRLSSALHLGGGKDDPNGDKAWETLLALNGRERDGDCIRLSATPASLRDGSGIPVREFRNIIIENYKELMAAGNVEQAFKAIAGFRVFSPLRNGPYGVAAINKLIEDTLSLKGISRQGVDFKPLDIDGEFYRYRLIMIKRNDYGLNLFNGDIGIVMPQDADGSAADTVRQTKDVVWFEAADRAKSNSESKEKKYRSFPCNMLPEHETAFAMTVHKSQGSQYENIMIVMPPEDNENLFAKELLYTAVTRAKKRVYLWCNEDVFKVTAIRRSKCASGLVDRLRAGDEPARLH